MNFPDTWPADCPPPDAVDADGEALFSVLTEEG
jgi:hypothetical protein